MSKKKLVINNKVWLLISLFVALCLWYMLSIGEATSRSFPFLDKVIPSVGRMIERGVFGKDIASSMICVVCGFTLGFITALPVAFLMAWYAPVQKIIEPWINFIRNIIILMNCELHFSYSLGLFFIDKLIYCKGVIF